MYVGFGIALQHKPFNGNVLYFIIMRLLLKIAIFIGQFPRLNEIYSAAFISLPNHSRNLQT